MKKIVLTMVLVFALSSIGFASPLMDYSQGKASFDITYRPNLDGKITENTPEREPRAISSDEEYPLNSLDGKGWDLGVTLGLGNDFAFQYRQFEPKAELWNDSGSSQPQVLRNGDSAYTWYDTCEGKIRSQEFNILYKLDKNVAAFTGVVRVLPSATYRYGETWNSNTQNRWYAEQGKEKNIWQFGLVGSAEIANKTNAYGIASLGSDYRSWEAGLSYEVAKDVEFNVNYRNIKFDKLILEECTHNGFNHEPNYDVTVKGFGFGVTAKF